MDYDFEKWKPIFDSRFPHEVSNFGRLRNKDSLAILKFHFTPKGYQRVTLECRGLRKNYFVHTLVARAFLATPQEQLQVNHKDGDKQNNCSKNLEFVSNQENMEHAIRTGLTRKNRVLKITDEEVVLMRSQRGSISVTELAKKHNVTKSTISHILCGNSRRGL